MAQEGIKFIEGSTLRCPKCLVAQNVLAYKPLGMSDHFADELTPILKCRKCGWLFAPSLSTEVLDLITPREVAAA